MGNFRGNTQYASAYFKYIILIFIEIWNPCFKSATSFTYSKKCENNKNIFVPIKCICLKIAWLYFYVWNILNDIDIYTIYNNITYQYQLKESKSEWISNFDINDGCHWNISEIQINEQLIAWLGYAMRLCYTILYYVMLCYAMYLFIFLWQQFRFFFSIG